MNPAACSVGGGLEAVAPEIGFAVQPTLSEPKVSTLLAFQISFPNTFQESSMNIWETIIEF